MSYIVVSSQSDSRFGVRMAVGPFDSEDEARNYWAYDLFTDRVAWLMPPVPEAKPTALKIVPCSCHCGGELAWMVILDSGSERMVGCVCHTTTQQLAQAMKVRLP